MSRAVQTLLDLAGQIRIGRLTVQLPDGTRVPFAGPEAGPEGILILNRERLSERLANDGALGLAEAWLDGDWDTPDLVRLLEVLGRNEQVFAPLLERAWSDRLMRRMRELVARQPSQQGEIVPRDRLTASFYEQWLDPTMGHASGLFETGRERLDQAQWAKCRRLGELTGLASGHRLLDFGCTFGTFTAFAAGEVGAKVTAVALTPSQQDYTARRIQALGLTDRVTVRLGELEAVSGPFDRIVSLAAIETSGASQPFRILSQLRERLAPEGRIGIETVVVQDSRYATYRSSTDVIRLHVYPGTALLSPRSLEENVRRAGLTVGRRESIGASGEKTIADWRRRFAVAWPRLEAQGFEPRFRRLWEFWLAYAEAAFRLERADVLLLALDPA